MAAALLTWLLAVTKYTKTHWKYKPLEDWF